MHESRPEQQQINLFGTEWYRLYDMYTHLSTTAVSHFLYCFTMSWWVNSWISVELQLCCCGNKKRVRTSHQPVRKFVDGLGKIWFAHARASVCTLLLHAPGLVSCVRQHASCQPCSSLFWSCLGFAALKNNLSLLEGLEFTPPSSAKTKGGICRPQE